MLFIRTLTFSNLVCSYKENGKKLLKFSTFYFTKLTQDTHLDMFLG